MDSVQDQIRLAEAMGMSFHQTWRGGQFHKDGEWISFNPFTNANDDYAVLEWMRERGAAFTSRVEIDPWPLAYRVGNYARAALRVLPDPDTGEEND